MNPTQFPLTDDKPVTAAVQPIKFSIRYKTQADGTLKAVECVEVAKKGVTIPNTTPHEIARIKSAAAKATEPTDEHAALWAAVKPYYDNWKAGGTEEVINGTPLAVWAGVTVDVVEALKPFRIYSVEDLSIMSDAIMQKVPNPNMSLYRDRAKKFLATKDIAIAVRDLSNATQENADLKSRMAMLEKRLADAEFAQAETEEELAEAVPAQVRRRKAKTA